MANEITTLYTTISGVKQDFSTNWKENSKSDWKIDWAVSGGEEEGGWSEQEADITPGAASQVDSIRFIVKSTYQVVDGTTETRIGFDESIGLGQLVNDPESRLAAFCTASFDDSTPSTFTVSLRKIENDFTRTDKQLSIQIYKNGSLIKIIGLGYPTDSENNWGYTFNAESFYYIPLTPLDDIEVVLNFIS